MAKFRLLFSIIIVFCFLATLQIPIQAQDQGKEKPNQAETEGFASVDEVVKFVNKTLSVYPGRDGESYTQTTQLSVKSDGKLVFYTQYNNNPTDSSGITAREEIHIDELDASKNYFFIKDKYLILNLHCKETYSHCVQRFFRESNTKAFRPLGYSDELVILTSLNVKKANMVVEALNQLVKLYAGSLPNKKVVEPTDKPSESSISETPSLRKTASLTMEDIEKKRPPADKKAKEKQTTVKTGQTSPESTNTEKTEQEQSLEELLKMLDPK